MKLDARDWAKYKLEDFQVIYEPITETHGEFNLLLNGESVEVTFDREVVSRYTIDCINNCMVGGQEMEGALEEMMRGICAATVKANIQHAKAILANELGEEGAAVLENESDT